MKLESTQKLLQILAILIAGVWAIWLYFDHDREAGQQEIEARRQEIEARQLSNKQTKDLAEIERDSRRLGRDQQEFALKQARLLSDTDRRSKEIGLQQQQLAYRQAVLSADTVRDQQRFSAHLTDLEGRLRSAELSFRNQGRLTYNTSVNITCAETSGNRYYAEFTGSITNSSQTTVEITWTFLRAFFGPAVSSTSSNRGDVVTENEPAYLFGEPSTSPIRWQERYRVGYIFESSRLPREFLSLIDGRAGSGATGRLVSGGTYSMSLRFIITGSPGDRFYAMWLIGRDGYWIDQRGDVRRSQGVWPSPDASPEDTGIHQSDSAEDLPDCNHPNGTRAS